MGLPLPPPGERFERLEETLRIALRMWAGDQPPVPRAPHQLDAPDLQPAAADAAAPADPDRRHRRAHTLRAGGAVRRRVQPVRHPRRRRDGAPQAGRAGASTASEVGRPYADDREDDLARGSTPGDRRPGASPIAAPARRARHRPRRAHHQRALDAGEDRHAHHGHRLSIRWLGQRCSLRWARGFIVRAGAARLVGVPACRWCPHIDAARAMSL